MLYGPEGTKSLAELSLRKNGLRTLRVPSGLWRLEVAENPLTSIPGETWRDVETSLGELQLVRVGLVSVPSSLGSLAKLWVLDLSYNLIAEVGMGWPSGLRELRLRGNLIASLGPGSLAGLRDLRVLDLSDNLLATLHPAALLPCGQSLAALDMSTNLLWQMPALRQLRGLRYFDLSGNRLASLSTPHDPGPMPSLILQEFHLERNRITTLTSTDSMDVRGAERTFLDFNPLHHIDWGFFDNFYTQELFLSGCSLKNFTSASNISNLRNIDLSYNSISNLSLAEVQDLTTLNLAGNPLELSASSKFPNKGLQFLDVSRLGIGPKPIVALRGLSQLRELKISNAVRLESVMQLDNYTLGVLSPSLQHLTISPGVVSSIGHRAFWAVPSLKILNLSYTALKHIEWDAFDDIGSSLEILILRSTQLQNLSPKSFRPLQFLKILDLGSNFVNYLPPDIFGGMSQLSKLHLNFNMITSISKIHLEDLRQLRELDLSFNRLRKIVSDTFSNLGTLEKLFLNDNLIEVVERSAFCDLNSLTHVRLEGNAIAVIANEAFNVLPKVQLIGLAYNTLEYVSPDMFNQVGMLSELRIDVRRNRIGIMLDAESTPIVSVQYLDLGGNDVSQLTASFFASFRETLREFKLNENGIGTIPPYFFSSFKWLQNLDLGGNNISTLNRTSLSGLIHLKTLDLSRNILPKILKGTFDNLPSLRTLNLSRNLLESLYPLANLSLRYLDLSHNRLEKMPDFYYLGYYLQSLRMTSNKLSVISVRDLSPLKNLIELDLADNDIGYLEKGIFASLNKLVSLDLSGNQLLNLGPETFSGLEGSLVELKLERCYLAALPPLENLTHLRIVKLENNRLAEVKVEESWVELDLRANLISSTPLGGVHLRSLDLSGNPLAELGSWPPNLVRLSLPSLLPDLPPALKHLDLEVPPRNLSLLQVLSPGLESLRVRAPTKRLGTVTTTALVLDGACPGETLELIGAPGSELTVTLACSHRLDLRGHVTGLRLTLNSRAELPDYSKLSNSAGHRVRLTELELSNGPWDCGSQSGWVVIWLQNLQDRERRVEALRSARCSGDPQHSVLDLFKSNPDYQMARLTSKAVKASWSWIGALALWTLVDVCLTAS